MNQLSKRHSECVNSAEREHASTHQIRLEYDQVFRLLDTLENLDRKSIQEFDIQQLREDLDDACWLAHWKREYVHLDDARLTFLELEKLLSNNTK